MEADAYKLASILGGEKRFLIPTFQRDYEWTERDQWSLLFDDLIDTAARLSGARAHAEATGMSEAIAEKNVAPHFLGAIVLDQLPVRVGEIDQRAVIDGQQRLTTIQLLIRALADVLAERGSSRVAMVRRLLFNPVDDQTADPAVRYKLWPRRRDRDTWRAAMDDDVNRAPEDHPYGKARRYFAARIRKAIDWEAGSTSEATTDVQRAEAAEEFEPLDIEVLVDAAVGMFKIVAIDLDENDDAQVIFEVLNGRQTPLSAADLVKNLLFLRAEVADEEQLESLHEEYWAPLEEAWWKVHVGRGHAARHRRELLLAAWLSAQTGEEANVGHLYGEIRRYLNTEAWEVREVLSQIGAYRDAYRSLAEPAESRLGHRVATAYRRLNMLGITTAYPLLLWLRTLSEEKLTAADHERAVTAVESWVMRRLVTRRNTRGYGKLFLTALERAKEAERRDGDIARAIVRSLDEGRLDWPDDAAVVRAFERDQFYNYHSQQRIRMILSAIDEQLAARQPKSERATFDYDSLQIEHVMPRGWRPKWPVPLGDELAAARRDEAIDRLGNLTLVTEALNPALSNGAWSAKRPEIAQHSHLSLNRELATYSEWDEGSIEERGRRLAQIAIEIWPGADSLAK